MDQIELPLAVAVFGSFFLFLGGAFLGARFFSIRINEEDNLFQDQLPLAVRGLPEDLARRWAQELLDWSRSLDEETAGKIPCLVGGDGPPEPCGLRALAKPVPAPPDTHRSIQDFEQFVGSGLAICATPLTNLHQPTFFRDEDLSGDVPGASPSGIVCCVGDGVEEVDPCMSADPTSGRCYVYWITEKDNEQFPTIFHGVLYLYLQECAGRAEMEKAKSDQS